jgi:poly(A) polymerase
METEGGAQVPTEQVVICYEHSTREDKEETKEIVRILREDFNQYESDAESRNRETVLAKLSQIIKEWIREVGRLKKKDENTIMNSGGKVFTFGSYRLGVHAPNTDIDALCVAPRHVDRENDFFVTLYNMLSENPSVKNLYPVKKGFVPRIGMEFEGIEIDLVFARI